MEVGKLLSKLFDLVEASPNNLSEIRETLVQLQDVSAEVSDMALQDYLLEFVENSLMPDYLENSFEDFSGKLNEIVIEFGNEGYFGEEF